MGYLRDALGETVVRLKPFLRFAQVSFHFIWKPRKPTCPKNLLTTRNQRAWKKCCPHVEIFCNYNTITLAHRYNSQELTSVQLLSLRPHDCSTPGFPVHHQLPELAQTHIHRVGDTIQPSHPLSSPPFPTFNLSQYQDLFQWVSSSVRWPRYWSFSFSISPSNEYSGLISFRMDWLDLLAVQGTLKSLLQRLSTYYLAKYLWIFCCWLLIFTFFFKFKYLNYSNNDFRQNDQCCYWIYIL